MDDACLAPDPFKLTTATRTLLDDRLADLQIKDAATLTTAVGRATASANVQTAFDQLRTLFKDGSISFKAWAALPSPMRIAWECSRRMVGRAV